KEKSLDERFNKYLSNLMDIYKKNSNEFKLSNLDKLSIDIPLSKVDNDVEDLQFRIHSICKPNEYLNFFDYTQEEVFSKIFSYFLKNNIQEFVKQIKSIQVSIKNPNLDSSMKIGSLFSCLYMEFNQNADKYILYQGNWFSLNKNIWYETKDFVNSIPSETYGIDFKEFNNTDNDEGDYNLKISSLESNKGLICLDKKNFTSKNVGGGFTFYGINPQSKIEPCDILKVSNDNAIFCHIKRGTKSSGLSHLLSQARTSCNLIRSSEEFVNYINSVIQKESSDVHTVCLNDANLKFSKVILGCIVPASKVQTKNSNLFPILFCLNLVALVNALFLDKFEVSLVKIPDKKTS
ncbi:TIGR04141 family sporadically distributed protein, partial [Enterococcus faecalis]